MITTVRNTQDHLNNQKQKLRECLTRALKKVAASAPLVIVGPLYSGEPLSSEVPGLFIDGGALFFNHNPLSVRVGDGDSFSGDLDITLPRHKDVSDLGFCLQTLGTLKAHLDLMGFRGGRWDHELANLGEIHSWLSLTHHSTPTPSALCRIHPETWGLGPGRWKIVTHGEFSLMSLERQNLSLSGQIRFPLDENSYLSTLSSRTLSNVAYGEFELKNTAPVFLIKSGPNIRLHFI